MTDNTFRSLHPLVQKDSRPQLTMPGAEIGDGTDGINSNTYNHKPYEDSLLAWGTKLLHTAYIVVDDVIPGGEFKRYSKFVKIHRDERNYRGILLRFTGQKSSLYTLEDIAPGPKAGPRGSSSSKGAKAMNAGEVEIDSTGRDAIDLMNKSSGGNPIQLDSVYEIDLLPLQSTRSCLITDNMVLRFNFNNGDRVERDFPAKFGRNLYVAFDVINNAPLPQIIRFDVQVLMMVDMQADKGSLPARTPVAQGPTSTVPVGRVSSARPNGVSGTVPIGGETNALDAISDNYPRT